MNDFIITTSWDDGHPMDIKLAKLLKEYNIPATFYIPIKNPEREVMNEDAVRKIGSNFDVGGHNYNHIPLTNLSKENAKKEIFEGKEELEKIIDQKVQTYCYPQGKYNNDHMDMVREAGFIGARTIDSFKTTKFENPYELGTTLKFIEPELHQIKRYFLNLDYKIQELELISYLFLIERSKLKVK